MAKKSLVTSSREPGRAFIIGAPRELDFEIGNYGFSCEWWGMVPAQQWLNEVHAHIHLETGYVSEGEGEMAIENRKYPLKRGDVFVAMPGETHSIQSSAGGSLGLQYASYNVSLHARKAPEVAAEMKSYGLMLRRFLACRERVKPDGPDGEVGAMAGIIGREIAGSRHGWEQVVRAASRALILGMARLFVPTSSPPVFLGRGEWTWLDWTTMRGEAASSRAFSFMSSHIREDIRVEDVARHVGTSVRNLQRIFGKWGLNFRQVMHDWRMKKARLLLITTEMSVGRIAREVGISNASHLIFGFRREFGLSPRRFRKLREP